MTMEELSLLLYLKDASHELSRKNLGVIQDLVMRPYGGGSWLVMKRWLR